MRAGAILDMATKKTCLRGCQVKKRPQEVRDWAMQKSGGRVFGNHFGFTVKISLKTVTTFPGKCLLSLSSRKCFFLLKNQFVFILRTLRIM